LNIFAEVEKINIYPVYQQSFYADTPFLLSTIALPRGENAQGSIYSFFIQFIPILFVFSPGVPFLSKPIDRLLS